jgi:hypothetical protein
LFNFYRQYSKFAASANREGIDGDGLPAGNDLLTLLFVQQLQPALLEIYACLCT